MKLSIYVFIYDISDHRNYFMSNNQPKKLFLGLNVVILTRLSELLSSEILYTLTQHYKYRVL